MKSLQEMSLGLLMMHGHLSPEMVRELRGEEATELKASANLKAKKDQNVCQPKLAACC